MAITHPDGKRALRRHYSGSPTASPLPRWWSVWGTSGPVRSRCSAAPVGLLWSAGPWHKSAAEKGLLAQPVRNVAPDPQGTSLGIICTALSALRLVELNTKPVHHFLGLVFLMGFTLVKFWKGDFILWEHFLHSSESAFVWFLDPSFALPA